MKIITFILFLSTISVFAEAYPVGRRGGLSGNVWTNIGIGGGIPSITTIYTNLTSSVSLTALNAAIQNCPSNQVVLLGSGTYAIGGGIIDLTKNGVVLRGTTNTLGASLTILNNCQVETVTYWGPESGSGGFPAVTVRDVSSGYTEGSTTITLSSAPNADFAAGAIFVIDQTDDSVNVWPDSNSGLYTRSGRAYCQSLLCTAISGNNITFTPPLLGTYWAAGRTPQVYGWNSVYGTTRHKVGLEDVDIVEGTSTSNNETVKFMSCYNCWIKNCRVNLTPYAATALMWSVNSEERGCEIHDASDNGSGTYGILMALTSQCRVESNIYTNLSLACVMASAVGCSVSFNYGVGPYPYTLISCQDIWLAEHVFPHGGHCHHNCFEGNWFNGSIEADDVFGNNSSDNGVVRNRLFGWALNKTLNTTPIILGESGAGDHHNWTMLGNILGENSYHTTYGDMYYINTPCVGTIRTNNYNTVNDAVNSAETMGVDTMLTSYVYMSTPDWFGNRVWPFIQPTTSYTNNTHYTNLPAGFRSAMGSNVPSINIFGGNARPARIRSNIRLKP